ncbi:MAG: helix-turn-helix domain-containing protein [Acidimicrobiales bacterium]
MRSDDLEATLGERFRTLRLSRRLTQAELAERANVSLGALKHLETGAGVTTATLTKVVRALGQERWIEDLAPAPAFNPLDLLEARERRERRQRQGPRRVRARGGERPAGAAP